MTTDNELVRYQTSRILRFLQTHAPERFDELIAEYGETSICTLSDNHALGPEDEEPEAAPLRRIHRSVTEKALSLRDDLLNRIDREERKTRRLDMLTFGVALLGVLLGAIFYIYSAYQDLGYIIGLMVALIGILATRHLDGRVEKLALSKARIKALIDVLTRVQSIEDGELIRGELLRAISDDGLLRELGGPHRLK
jgi:hypothetical protein